VTRKLTNIDVARAQELVTICEERGLIHRAYHPLNEVLELFPLLVDAVVVMRDEDPTPESRALAEVWGHTRKAHELMESIRPPGGWPQKKEGER